MDEETMYKTMRDIINMGFTREEAKKFGNKKLIIELYFDSDSGYIREVKFSFYYNAPYIYIPIERFREIEVELKRHTHFVTTEEGKKRNYIYMGWSTVPTGGIKLK